MWTIAAGIIIALVILATLPPLLEFFAVVASGAVIVALVVLGVALVVTAGYFFFTNLSDALVVCSLVLIGAFILVVFSIYAKSKNASLFFRELALRLVITTSPRKRAEKEFALERLEKDIKAHCASRNAAIAQTALEDILTVANAVWNRFREYGDLTHSSTADQIRFASPKLGELFSVDVTANFPQNDLPTLRMQDKARRQPELGTSARELKSAMKRTVKWRVLEFERRRVRERGSTDAPQA